MKIEKNKIFTSPSDLNNFTLCKYHIKNDKLSFEKKRLRFGHLHLLPTTGPISANDGCGQTGRNGPG